MPTQVVHNWRIEKLFRRQVHVTVINVVRRMWFCMDGSCRSRSRAGYCNPRRLFTHRVASLCILSTRFRSLWRYGVTSWTAKSSWGRAIAKQRGRKIAGVSSAKPPRIMKKTCENPSLHCKEGLNEVSMATPRSIVKKRGRRLLAAVLQWPGAS